MSDSKSRSKRVGTALLARADSKEAQRCSECGSTIIVRDFENAEIVCMNCGLVVAAKILDRGPEWRVFYDDKREKRARVGAPLTFTIHDKGLSTVIDWHDRDVYGKKVTQTQKAQIHRLRKWQRRLRVSGATERNLAFALSEIAKIADYLSLPKSISETASVICRTAVRQRLVRGRSIKAISAAAVYIACRQCRLIRTLDEIAAATNVNKKEIGRSYRFLVRKLGYFVPPTKPIQYVSKFSNQFSAHGKVEEIASAILKTADELRLSFGREPRGTAAAASYIASVLTGERQTQREAAEIAQVSGVTLRKRYRELSEHLLFVLGL